MQKVKEEVGPLAGPEDAEAFEWDDEDAEDGNVAHLAQRVPAISPREAEEVFENRGQFARNKREGSGDWLLIGRTFGGRALTLVLVYKEDRRLLRVFTGWDCTQRERTRYL